MNRSSLRPIHTVRLASTFVALISLWWVTLTLNAAAAEQPTEPGTQTEGVLIENAYARAVPPGQRNSAVFFEIRNSTHQDAALVAATSPAADVIELHTHSKEDGMMVMRRIDRIALPAGSAVVLEPGGLHLMLIDLTAPLDVGTKVPLELEFDDGRRIAVTAETRAILPAHSMSHQENAD